MTIFLDEYIDPQARKHLEKYATVVNHFDDPNAIDGIILRVYPVDAELMKKCKNLKVIGKHGVGCNTIDLESARKLGITVVNTPRANTNSVAELIVGEILDIARNITTAHNKSKHGEFTTIAPTEMTGIELTGKTLGLIGTGNIAQRTAEILTGGFGMKVVAYDPYVSAETMEKLGYQKYEDIGDMIAQADVVNISVPLTPSTKDLVSGEIFDRFKPGAILVNAARGGIVNEKDLYEALSTGKLRAAACDAFVTEPPSAENTALYNLPNFVGTPHIGATTHEALERMGMEIVDEVLQVLNGGEARNRVV